MAWLDQLLNGRKIWSMAVVRRYCDANGAFVGELYLLGAQGAGPLEYRMIGVSLDTLPFAPKKVETFDLDTGRDFLAPMAEGMLRVGALDPRDNDAVREMVAQLARTGVIALQVQNRFVEHIMQQRQ